MEIYSSRIHGSEKKSFNDMMIMACKWFSDIMVAILDLW